VLLAKNEEKYIEEWARFHLLVGADHFFVYNDGSTDRTIEILRDVVPSGLLTVTSWKNGEPYDVRRDRYLDNQVLAYVHAVANFGGDYRWMTFIDTDEFILPKRNESIEEALSAVGGFPNVSLPWHMFGRSGHMEKPEGGVLANFTERADNPVSELAGVCNFKCIIDPCQVTQIAIHGCKTRNEGNQSCNDVGKIAALDQRATKEFYSADILQLNHYYSKSEAELRDKLARGSASPISGRHYSELVRETVANIEKKTVQDLSMAEFVANRIQG